MDYLLGAEAGDAIFALPSIASGSTLWAVDRPWCRPDWQRRSESIKRLVEAQGFTLKQGHPRSYDVDLTTYRALPALVGTSIAQRVASHIGASPDLSKSWLQVDPSPKTKGRIVVARGPRWRGYHFPWASIVRQYQREILFVGLDEEYIEFCREFGHVERHPTKDLYDVARAIKGSELFIGSQSSPNAVCEGLKHPSVLEVCPTSLDCIYYRPTTVYSADGSLSFSACGKEFHSGPTNPPDRYRVLWNNNYIYHHDPDGLKFVLRANYALRRMFPSLSALSAQIEQNQR